MPDLKRQTPRQRAQMTYMMDVMRRLEWDLHNTIELTDGHAPCGEGEGDAGVGGGCAEVLPVHGRGLRAADQ